jgi:hypothetical protein
MDQIVQQPTVFKRAAPADLFKSVRHDQSVGFSERQNHGFDYVARERTRCANTHVSVDEYKAMRASVALVDHADRTLLPICGQARAHASSATRILDAKRCVAQLQLAQLDLHRREARAGRRRPRSRLAHDRVGLCRFAS